MNIAWKVNEFNTLSVKNKVLTLRYTKLITLQKFFIHVCNVKVLKVKIYMKSSWYHIFNIWKFCIKTMEKPKSSPFSVGNFDYKVLPWNELNYKIIPHLQCQFTNSAAFAIIPQYEQIHPPFSCEMVKSEVLTGILHIHLIHEYYQYEMVKSECLHEIGVR